MVPIVRTVTCDLYIRRDVHFCRSIVTSCVVISSLLHCFAYRMAMKGSEDGLVKLWNLEISDFTANLRGHQGTVSCVDIAPDEAFVVSGSSSDRSVKIWSIIMSCIITDYRV